MNDMSCRVLGFAMLAADYCRKQGLNVLRCHDPESLREKRRHLFQVDVMVPRYRILDNGTVEYTICPYLPPRVNSDGVWKFLRDRNNNPLDYGLSRLNLELITVFLVTEACHFMLKRIGMTKLVSQILVSSNFDVLLLLVWHR